MFRRVCAVLLVLAVLVMAGCSDTDARERAAREAAEAYLDSWAAGELTDSADRTDNSAAALLNLRAVATSLGFGEGAQPLQTSVTSVNLTEGGARVSFTGESPSRFSSKAANTVEPAPCRWPTPPWETSAELYG